MIKRILKYYFSFVKIVNRYLWSDEAVQKRSVYIKYLFALVLLFLTTVFKLYFNDVIGIQTPFLLYFGIVILCTGYGGIGPGIFATLASALIADYYFLPPFRHFHISQDQFIQMFVFIIECLLLIGLSGAVTRASRTVKRSADRFRALIENSKDAIAVLDMQGKVLYASPATEKVLGYTAKEFKALNVWSKVSVEELEELQKYFEETLKAEGNSNTIVHMFNNKNGEWVWIESTLTNLLNNPNVEGIVSNFRNVTEKVILEKQKDDFIGIATHELKTPVTSIKAYAQILLKRFKKDGNEAAADMVEKMDAQLNKLIGLIADLLDVTKIEGGRLELHEEYYDFNDLVNEVAEELQRTTDEHTIILELDPSTKIYGDKERIGQVLSNLISNAIKYSPTTSDIIIKSSVEKNGITLCVIDKGVGISKENQEKVFERFYRVSGPNSFTFPGLGLGLYISYEIIKRQGGKIWVLSEPGKGSTFCFSLPFNHTMDNKRM